MILIADSGSTKTTWMDVESGNKVVTDGLNPHFTTDEAFLAACQQVRRHLACEETSAQTGGIRTLIFYGAGCGSEEQSDRVASLLDKSFGTSDIYVETDMLGACRAVCGHKAGLVGILGTGSNACYYDGRKIVYQAPSAGYILGDQGSANHVGRQLLRDYFSDYMPKSVKTMFHEVYPQTIDEFLDAIYHRPNANRFLASVGRFAVEHQNNDYCSMLIELSLIEWGTYQLVGLREQSLCRDLYLVGGYAARIGRKLLNSFAQGYDLAIKAVLADPIEGLRRYHSAN